MLETCGMFFNRGAAGKKLDYFLSFFQVRQAYQLGVGGVANQISLQVLCPHEISPAPGY